MAAVSTNIRIDEDLKREAQALFEDLGLTMTVAVNMFLKQAVREQSIPFEVTRNPNKVTLNAINNGLNNDDMHGPFKSVDDLMEELNA